MQQHPIRSALIEANTKAISFVHNARQTATAAYVDDKRVLVFGDAFYNEAAGLGNVTHYRGYEPFPLLFDTSLTPCTAPTKPGPLARKFNRIAAEADKLRVSLNAKVDLKKAKQLRALADSAERLKRVLTFLGK
jgi:hypothetical protein